MPELDYSHAVHALSRETQNPNKAQALFNFAYQGAKVKLGEDRETLIIVLDL